MKARLSAASFAALAATAIFVAPVRGQEQAPPFDWSGALALPEVKLHLYGKTEPRPRRKMGHITALADTVDEAIEKALTARDLLI